MPVRRRQRRRRSGSIPSTRRPGSSSPASPTRRCRKRRGGQVQETSLLELFESALGRPCQSGRPLVERPLPPAELDLDEWPLEVAEPVADYAPPPVRERDTPAAPRARVVTPGLLVSL